MKPILPSDPAKNIEKYPFDLDDLPEPVFCLDPDGKIIYANNACGLCFHARLPGPLIGEQIQQLIHPDDRSAFEQKIQQLTPDKPTGTCEIRLSAQPGGLCWQQWTIKAIFLPDQQLSQYLVMGFDITDRKRVEDNLRQSEEMFRRIFENAPIMIDSFDQDGNCLLWNNSCEKILGWTKEEVNASKDPFSLFYPDPELREIVTQNIQRVNGLFREYRVREKSGTYRTQLWADFTLPNGPLISIGYDITERQQFEEDLRKYRDHLEEMVKERTAQLEKLNEQLQCEIMDRKQAENAEREQRTLAEALRNISDVLSSTLDINKVLDNILSNVGRVVPHDAGYILLLDPSRSHPYVARYKGFAGSEAVRLKKMRLSLDEAFDLRRMSQDLAPCLIPNVKTETQRVSAADFDWVSSYAGVPVVFGNEVIGFLILLSSIPDFFTPEHTSRLITFANQASIAIHNARMYEQAQELAIIEERQRLAREMHDAVSQTVFSASIIAETLPRLYESNPKSIITGLYELQKLTRGAQAEMRTLLVELRPQTLENSDLGVLIRQLADGLEGRTSIEAAVEIKGQFAVATEIKTTFFRIAQEALNNIVKHARASRVTISLNGQPGSIHLTIRDNGRGFRLDEVSSDRLGLKILHERAEAVGANLKIDSIIGLGTSIDLIWENGELKE